MATIPNLVLMITGLYALALLVSAALLFVLEPMVGKFVLPLLGSTPEVWPTTMLFFQAALLAGYGRACDRRSRPCREDRRIRTWTDDYSNPLAVVDWG
jgi:hypothetical protein